jgi:3-hydroxybutyryl-CoA dehydratase
VRFSSSFLYNIGVTAKATVMEVITEKNRVIMQTTCTNQNGEIVLDGQAMLSPRKV